MNRLGEQFAVVIKARLDELGMSQADLAREMGVTPKHINQMLTGKATGSPGMLDFVAYTLGFEWQVTAVDNGHAKAPPTPQYEWDGWVDLDWAEQRARQATAGGPEPLDNGSRKRPDESHQNGRGGER